MSTLHVVGSLRALNSVLDCLAAGIVGISALPLDIQRAGFGAVINAQDSHGYNVFKTFAAARIV